MYRSVNELTHDELNELKSDMFWNRIDYENIEGGDEDILDIASCPEDIPDDLAQKRYADISFVEDDFFCNQQSMKQ